MLPFSRTCVCRLTPGLLLSNPFTCSRELRLRRLRVLPRRRRVSLSYSLLKHDANAFPQVFPWACTAAQPGTKASRLPPPRTLSRHPLTAAPCPLCPSPLPRRSATSSKSDTSLPSPHPRDKDCEMRLSSCALRMRTNCFGLPPSDHTLLHNFLVVSNFVCSTMQLDCVYLPKQYLSSFVLCLCDKKQNDHVTVSLDGTSNPPYTPATRLARLACRHLALG
jgi:hypothetical protein